MSPAEWNKIRAEAMAPSHGNRPSSRGEYAAAVLAALAKRGSHGAKLGTKGELQALCEVSAGTFNEAIKLAQSRGIISLRPGSGGGVFVAEQTAMVRLGNSVIALDGDSTSVADAVRMRDALDPLLVEDALWNSSAIDHQAMRDRLVEMRRCIDNADPDSFARANWALHATIAEISPSAILRSVYLSLLDVIESHTIAVRASQEEPLLDYIASRFDLHERLVTAIATRDKDLALALIGEHNNTRTAAGSS